MEGNSTGGAGSTVRVDGFVLPPWALNSHHYVYTNVMALEQDEVRGKLNEWIDLVFGVHQQDPAFHNLFKPLTSEVSAVVPNNRNRKWSSANFLATP